MKIELRRCVIDDLVTLRELSYRTYHDTFACTNTPSDMKAYLDKAFDISKLQKELSDSNSDFYLMYAEKELAGYLKLNEYEAQTDINDPESLEIERIYVSKEYQGKGLGNVLMNKAIEIARLRNRSYLWLGVWERNEKAILFYKKYGFYEIGKHSFFMGEDEQTDFIMRKDLL